MVQDDYPYGWQNSGKSLILVRAISFFQLILLVKNDISQYYVI